MEKIKNQNGIISLFVLFSMLFLLIFCSSVYYLVRSKMQIQEHNSMEIQEIYSKNTENIKYAESTEIIPINNLYQLNFAGTGNYIQIEDTIYQYSRGATYALMNNIIIDIDEDLISGNIGFNDYKLYSSSYHINKSLYDIYYYKDGIYWKNVAYMKLDSKKQFPQIKTYLQDSFSILDEIKNR